MEGDKDPILKKIDSFTEILQNFGLQFIQSIGELKHSNSVLEDKINKVEKEILNIKSLEVQLKEIIKAKETFIKKVDQIEKFVESMNSKIATSPSQKIMEETSKKSKKNYDSPLHILEDLERELDEASSVFEIRNSLTDAKEGLYMLTGGHMVLFKLREVLRKLRPNTKLTPEFKEDLKQKIKKWKTFF